MRPRDYKSLFGEAGILLSLFGLLFGLQFFVGDFPIELFHFPLNLLLIVLWLVAMVESYRCRENSPVARLLLSTRATALSFLLLVLLGITLGLQRHPASASWPVVGALLMVQTILGMVILRGWRNRQGIRWSFLMTHVGLWLTLVGTFWGAPDCRRVRLAVGREEATREAYYLDGTPKTLGYTLRLKEFTLESYANGVPSTYEAVVEIDSREVSLRVNHPYRCTPAEAVYLISYDQGSYPPRYCILEVVHEPWRGVTATGVWMMIFGALCLFMRRGHTTEKQ
uniref:cytochrome c biogenesis protein ResB n=1 Tax=Alistipes sp. TaxID=1872444 RepID=UPI004055ED77